MNSFATAISRRSMLAGAAGAPLLLGARPGSAQGSYPDRPVQIIVPFAPGGGTDIIARAMAQGLAQRLGRPFVVTNRAGAATVIGTDVVARAPADGHTLLFTSVPYVVNPSLRASMPYAEGALRPVTLVTSTPTVLVVNPSVPATTVPELIAWLRERPGDVNYASFGPGSGAHLATLLFEQAAAVRLFHVAYGGGGPALTAVMGGEVQMLFSSVLPVLGAIRGGRVRAIAVASERRSTSLPDLPTFREAGLDYVTGTWFGLMAPSGTPDDIVALLHREVREVMLEANVRRQLEAEDQEIVVNTPDEFGRFIAAETRRWREVISRAGIRPE